MVDKSTGQPNYRIPNADVSRAHPAAVDLLQQCFDGKNSHEVPHFLASFSKNMAAYSDATLGWKVPGWQPLHDLLLQYMPHWGIGVSYPTRILAGPTSAMVAVTDTPELFGGEIHALACVDFRDGQSVKLAAVLKGQAPDTLLDSYEAERRPIGAQLARNTQAQAALMTHFDEAHTALRAELSDLLLVPDVNRRLAGVLSGFDLRYAQNKWFGDEPGAGVRVPDRTLTLIDGSTENIHALLSGGNWLHLACEAGAKVPLPNWLSPDYVRYVDVRSLADNEVGAAALLVRPDGYSAGQVDCSRTA